MFIVVSQRARSFFGALAHGFSYFSPRRLTRATRVGVWAIAGWLGTASSAAAQTKQEHAVPPPAAATPSPDIAPTTSSAPSPSGAPSAPIPALPTPYTPDEIIAGARRAVDAAKVRADEIVTEEVSAYCEHLNAAHRSEAAQLRSPWVSARGMTLQRGELASSGRAVDPRLRLGLGFSLSDWFRASLVEERAQGGCALYEAEAQLRQQASDVEALSLEAWRAKAQLLGQAATEAQQLLRASDAELAASERTVAEHLAVLADYQALEQRLSQAELQVARLAVTRVPSPPNPRGLKSLRESAAELERVEGALRRNRSFSLDIEGGYDEIVNTPQKVPVYGQVNMTFRPGYFWQNRADELSENARARATSYRARSEEQELQQAVTRIDVSRAPLRAQLERHQRVLSLLEQKHSALRHIPRPDAKHLTERLWFQIQLNRAEVRHLELSLQAMDEWLSEVTPGTRR